MSFLSNIQPSVKRALSRFNNSEPAQQLMLKVLAVVYKPIGQAEFKRILKRIEQDLSFSPSPLKLNFTPELKKSLLDHGLIEISSLGIKLPSHLHHALFSCCLNDGSFRDLAIAVDQVTHANPGFGWGHQYQLDKERQIRDLLYLGEFSAVEKLLELNKNPQQVDVEKLQCLMGFCFCPYDADFFHGLSPVLQYQAFASLMCYLRQHSLDNSEAIELLASLPPADDNMQLLLAEQYLLKGELDKASPLLARISESCYQLSLAGWLLFLQGDNAAALATFEQAQVAKLKITRRKRQYLGGIPGVFYLLALIQAGYQDDPAMLAKGIEEVNNYADDNRNLRYELGIYRCLEDLMRVLTGKVAKIRQYYLGSQFDEDDFQFRWKLLFSALCHGWTGEPLSTDLIARLSGIFNQSLERDDPWFSHLCGRLLKHHCPKESAEYHDAADYLVSHPEPPLDLLSLVAKKEPWLQALDQLLSLKREVGEAANDITAEKPSRLIWLLDADDYPYRLEAREQKRGKHGWTKGRAVSLKRLSEDWQRLDFLSDEDIALCQEIRLEVDYHYRWNRESYSLSGYEALAACIGHPRIYFMDDPAELVEVVAAEPELLITEAEGGYRLLMPGLPHDISDYDHFYSLTAQTANRYILLNYNKQQLEIAGIIGGEGLRVPKAAKDKVLESLKVVSPLLNIQSDLAGIGDVDTGIRQVDVDPALYINIQPHGQGLELECHVQPLGPEGPNLIPGSGNPLLSAQIGDERLSTRRSLENEQRHFEQLVEACPLFVYMSQHRLILDNLDDALECLEQLNVLQREDRDPALVLQWPKGKTIELTKTVSSQQMQISVGKHKDWFALDGQLNLPDNEVVELKNLLALVSENQGRFIPLENNKFLALTSQLRQQLQQLGNSSFNGQFHNLAVPLIDEATDGMVLKTGKAWQQQLSTLKQAYELKPQVPATLQANLRDYQVDGFEWAARLAHWGGGACLADDMGLGKTLQSLAVILSRAAEGPTLVLAPTSVCFNWQEEALRFAPALKPRLFGPHNKTERQAMLTHAGPFDLIICSYGLLQTEGEALCNVQWHSIIADEAQAIKNPAAKRTQQAMQLKGAFKMITTGTPIENNLTELWSLFRFINPGLLGTRDQFNTRFVSPMEADEKDKRPKKEVGRLLRQMIGPFILRRLKTDVLTELPSRTEINVHVALSKEEQHFYEALRRQALENMEATKGQPGQQGQKRIKILAEIMKLRQACCHPSLVMADCGIAGSKLRAFDELVDELRLGGHRALVFSQFVTHLDILRQHLDDKEIGYQYLDGSTPAPKRKKAVNAFQGGEGELFLISLKAGGAGLNLTAADYVIHMDPWWNPAVEDQASDRAHRMGQTRPVTIYRLITQNTIEDKIVALHQQKRELANSLLEGSDGTGKVSYEDMLALLSQQ